MSKRTSPAAQRNQAPILEVLRNVLPTSGRVLEIASGSGEHVVAFAAAFPTLEWQPSDPDAEALASIDAWAAESGPGNLRQALRLDVCEWPWPVRAVDAIVCINMIHIAPWTACLGLMRGAGELLPSGGLLYLYGPMMIDGRFTAASNAEFDASLRARDPDWGVRDVEAVAEAGRARGLELTQVLAMPANNFSLILRRDGAS
jgi:cyclopropane fatty-acyl-phospholipid synthase-like methyltransferase